ncbi:AraC family transcriptional regulator [Christensenellaceae bacterium NSJ-63]|uniref:AraC family transcriptional regulator n=1 Tax=Guopingia tenuis TaxID=2763656 RepID=A0A926DGS2_9FIRM|nr:AraC family transcriptional regulator [Guopingia tenuis]MBC8537504.1 AraC family transcriptional regulator [Guopingia tenuis]
MASVKDFCEKAELKQLTNLEETAEITDGYICDLLSWVMARGTEGMAWITVQTHLNVLAVACLHDFSCVVIPENIQVPEETVKKAQEEGIPLYSSPKTAYVLGGILHELGVGS